MMRPLSAVFLFLSAHAVIADVPRVSADILPVHSLVARVMQGAGTPDLILSPGASPHGYAMKPSQAAALARADLVVWIGEDLTPWMQTPIQNLAGQAEVIELLAVEGTVVLPFREGALFEEGEHDLEDGEHDHADDHGSIDPHAWLDPVNAGLWMSVIAERLAAQDPENASLYTKNAAEGQAELIAVRNKIDGIIAPFRGTRFMVFHDAYHYFEARFGTEAAGALALGDATAPSPARLAEIKASVAERQVACVFAEPQFNTSLVDAVIEGTDVRIALLDPMGTELDAGPELYGRLLTQMAAAMVGCAR